MKASWEVKKLEDVCENKASNVSQNQLDNEKGKYPIYGASGLIKNISFYRQDKPYISIVKDGAGIGRITLQPAHSSVIGTLQYLNPKDGMDINYLYYLLLGIDFNKYKKGAAIPHIYFKDYSQENILVPPLPEQRRIVEILDKTFEKLEKAKENAEKNLQNAKEVFESYLQSVFEKKGEGWEEKSIQEITKVINGYAFASEDFNSTNTIKSVKITNIGVKEFIEEVDNYLPEKFKKTLKEVQIKEGNIVIALTRTIISAGLKVAVVPASYDGALVNQRVAALVPNEKIINQRYLYNFLTTKGVVKYVLAHVNALMQPNLSINDLKNLPLTYPSLPEQRRIVSKLDTLSAETKKLEAIYQQKLNNFEELKKAILQKAFNGELTKD